MLLFTWWWLTCREFRFKGGHSGALIRSDFSALGPWSKAEKLITVVFTLAAIGWILQTTYLTGFLSWFGRLRVFTRA